MNVKSPLLWIGVALTSFFAPAAYAACPTWTPLINGSIADASQVMDNFACLAPLDSPSFTGTVGVGRTPTPIKLDVYSTINSVPFRIGSNQSSSFLEINSNLTSATADAGFVGYSDDKSLTLWTGNTERLRVNSVGNVGIGFSSPGYALDVYTSGSYTGARITSGNATVLRLDSTNIHAATRNWDIVTNGAVFGDLDIRQSNSNAGDPASAGTSRLYINPDGNVGIGTMSVSHALQVNGSVAGIGAYVDASDVRLKANILHLGDGVLSKVMKLKPVRFFWKEPRDAGMRGPQIGFIAQEVEEVFPAVVTTEPTSPHLKGIRYNELIPLLTKAVQEQEGEIQSLRYLLNEERRYRSTQESRIKRLESQLDGHHSHKLASN